MRAVVNCRVCELDIALYLLVVTICKCSIIQLPIQTSSIVTLKHVTILSFHLYIYTKDKKKREDDEQPNIRASNSHHSDYESLLSSGM
jgi:hypothetical protein